MLIVHKIMEMLFSADHEVLTEKNEARVQHRYAFVVQNLYSFRIPSYPTKNKNCAGNDEQFAKLLPPNQNTRVLSIQTKTWNLSVLAETYVDITTSQARTDQIPTDLPKKHFAGSEKKPLPFWSRRIFLQKWWSEQMGCFSYQRNVQDNLADRKSTCQTRFGTPFDGSDIPFGNEI